MGAPVSVAVAHVVDMAVLLAEAVAGGLLTAGSLDVAVCRPTCWRQARMRVMTWRTRSVLLTVMMMTMTMMMQSR